MHKTGMPLPRANYDDVDSIREVAESLRGLAMSLENQELRVRRNEVVSPLEAGFPENAIA